MSTTRLSILALIFVFVNALLLYSCNFKQENKETKIVDSSKKDTSVIAKNTFPKYDTFVKTSSDFIVNNINCYFKYETVSEDTLGYCNVVTQLIDKATGKAILENEDFYYGFNPEKFQIGQDDFNFDGNKDYSFYSNENSGSGGVFYKIYLFNNKTKRFDYSELLSGGNVEVDSLNKTVSNFWKMGAGFRSTENIRFGKQGKIKFIERKISEGIEGDTLGRRKITYEKKINSKIVKRKTYISADEY